MTIRLRKVLGTAVATALGVAGLAAPSTAAAPQRETGFLSGCLTDATGHVALSFTPTLTGVAALIGIGAATVTGASGDEFEALPAGSFFEDTAFVKTEAGVAQTIDVEGPPTSFCNVEFAVDGVPANDQPTNAEVIAGTTGSVAGSTRAATLDVPDEPQGFVNANRVVWYEWTAPATGPMRFEANPKIGGGFLDDAGIWTALGLAIYGPGNALTPLIVGGKTTADGGAAYGGLFEVDVTAGTKYKISVSSGDGTGEFASAFNYSAPGAFTLTWEPVVVAPLPTIKPGVAAVTESDSGTKTLNLPVTLSSASTQTVTAQWNTAFINAGNEHEAWPDGHLLANWDYVPASGVVTFAPGQTSATVPITINADLYDEWDELFAVSFHDPTNAKVGGFYGLGFGTITDNDPLPVIVAPLLQYRVAECECLGTITDFGVTLSAPTGRTVTVEVSLPFPPQPILATPGVDFTGGTGTYTFRPFVTQTVGVTILGDDIPEPDEHIAYVLHDPVNARIGGFYGLGTITIPANDN